MSNAGQMGLVQWFRFGDIPSSRCYYEYLAAMPGAAGGVHD
jgi:hypothetical protein